MFFEKSFFFQKTKKTNISKNKSFTNDCFFHMFETERLSLKKVLRTKQFVKDFM